MIYPKDTAGRLMTDSVPVIGVEFTVGQAERLIREKIHEFSTINYVYIVDEAKILRGVVSIKELIDLNENNSLASYVGRQMITVRPYTDQERVAHIALKNNIKSVPVVSKDGLFLGVVPSDVILEILNKEHTEDILRLAGVRPVIDDKSTGDLLLAGSSMFHVRSRLPWLILGLLGGVLAAVVVEQFEGTLENQLILAAFIPAIVYMADAVGSQTQMLFIRTLTINSNLKIPAYIKRESVVNFFLGVILSTLIFSLSYLWIGSILISSILAISIFLTVWFTVLVAILLPWFIYKHGFDPAVASGPLATVLRDIVSLCIYLLVASLLLSL